MKNPVRATTQSTQNILSSGRCVLGVLALGLVLGVSGCSSVSSAGRAVADKTRSVVGAVKRGASKTVSRVRTTASSAPKPRDGGRFALSGILMVVDPQTCSEPDGCGTRYQLFNNDFSIRTALTGQLHDVHDGLLVTVQGRWKAIEPQVLSGDGWRRGDQAVAVEEYEIHTGLRIRSFLSRQSAVYSKRVYRCDIRWPRTYAWRIVNREPYLIVRMSNPRLNGESPAFVELWYHGGTGTFLKETKSHANINPCV